MASAYLLVALIMGFTGSLHCVGMCGPIMLFMPFYHFKGAHRVAAIALYHLGRISMYALLALVVYTFRSAFDPKVQQYISMILGGTLLVAGVLAFIPGSKLQLKLPWTNLVQKNLNRFIGNPSLPSITASGMLNGLLPCGLVYMALSATLALHTPAEAVLFTFFFGIGTLPALVSIIVFRSRLGVAKMAAVRKMTPVVVFFFGCVFLLRGMNLGIPYLSPKVKVANGQIHSCCHNKKLFEVK